MTGLVHMVRTPASKWRLGRALCGSTISSYTPTTAQVQNATCARCDSIYRKAKLKCDDCFHTTAHDTRVNQCPTCGMGTVEDTEIFG